MKNTTAQQSSQLSEAKQQLLAKRLRGKDTSSAQKQTLPSRSNIGSIPLSFSQQRLWFIEQYEEGNVAYNIPFAFRIYGQVHVAALERSLNEILRRHNVLRTAFKTVDGKAEAHVLQALSTALTLIDLRGKSQEECDSHIADVARQDAAQGFDLERPPFFRLSLFQRKDDEFVLLMTIHHIVFDGWSIEVFMRELTQLYDDFSCGRAASLPELPLQYSDFARWQRGWLKGERLERQLNYWRKQLSGSAPLLELPTDRPRPAKQSFRGNSYAFPIPASTTENLKVLNQAEKSTLFMTLLTAFKILLYRYSGQEDILVGSPVANRQRSELEGLIGFFVNMLVLRDRLDGNLSFRELLERVRQTTLEAQAHQDIPFDLLVEELHPERDVSRQPFFQISFAFRSAPEQGLTLSGHKFESMLLCNGMAKFDIFLEIVAGGQGLQGNVEYNSDLFDLDTIRRMGAHFCNLLEGIAANPECRIAELPLLSPDERRQLLVGWNATSTAYPKNAAIHELFEEQVRQNPEAIALIFNDRRLTYRELNGRSNQVAYYLKKIGVGLETPVGICMDRSPEMIVALLGILKAGGAYIPFESSYPAERLSFMLEDTQVSVLLTQQSLLKELPQHTARPICLDSDWPMISQEQEVNLPNNAGGDSLAYVMYTSGSTGRPKGVCVTHRGVVRLVKNTNYVELNAEERFLQYAPIFFDASTFEIWGSLLNGARLVIMPGSKVSLEELGTVIREAQISTLWLTAGLFHLMVDTRLDDLRSVRQLLAGGDVLSVSHVQQVRRKIPTCRLINGYGPTENTTFSCCFTADETDEAYSSLPIGRPIANTEVYILDRELQPVPVGVFGELYIAGAGLAREYLNRPELTAQRFIKNPFGDDPNARLYRSGDVVRYLPDGNIEFLGRSDYQVKIRGFRIELGEIESVLLRYPDIHEAVVLAKTRESGDKYLAAYLVTHLEQGLPVDELRRFLGMHLPDYMIPAFFTFLEKLPLTPNGKIDRRALPEPAMGRSDCAHDFVAPRNAAEKRMAEIWASLLPVKSIGVHDDFFKLGGHSLLTVRLVSEIEKLFQVKLPLWKLFETPTIAGLLELMKQEDWQGPEKSVLDRQEINYCAEILLDEKIQIPPSPPLEKGEEKLPSLTGRGAGGKGEKLPSPTGSGGEGVFLTGATGFLGAFLLHELLQQTRADMYCLVRAADATSAKLRLKETMQDYLIWSAPLSERIIPVPGDLGEPLLGLAPEAFEGLARKVDRIYHSGAQVNLQYPYSALKAANVQGTQEILRLAARGGGTPVHFVSTVGVFSGKTHPPAPSLEKRGGEEHPSPSGRGAGGEGLEGTITEDCPLPDFEELTIGYAQTKWVAEKLMAVAHSRGIPVTIYRPARISGHSQTGVWNLSDFACRTIKGCVEAGIAPQRHMSPESWVPVDYVSRAILHLSQKAEASGQVYHLVNRRPLDWEWLFKRIAGLGYPLKILAYEHWRSEFCECAPDNELSPLMPLFPESLPEATPQGFAYWNTVAGLENSSISCPPLDDALLHTYLAYFLRSNFLYAPQLVNSFDEIPGHSSCMNSRLLGSDTEVCLSDVVIPAKAGIQN